LLGAVDHEQFVSLANKHFGHFPGYTGGKLPDMPEVIAPNPVTPYTGSMVTIENEDMKDVHFAVAVEGVSWNSPDYFPMLLVQTILGSWDKTVGAGKNLSSPLAEIVTRENLGSSFSTFNTCY
jgi:processing peptidase subunit beta